MGLKCIYCGWIGKPQDFEVDHNVPVSRMGSNNLPNLQFICSGCNRQKGNKTGAEYIIWRIFNNQIANYGPMKAG